MALPVHHGPSPRIFLLLLLPSISAQSASPPPPPPNSSNNGINLITGILFITLIFALFFLGFFTAYLRRCFIRNQAISSNATVAAAAAAAFAAHSPANRRCRGLDPAAIESFPAIPYSSVRKLKPFKYGASNECSVCLGEFCDEEVLRLLPGCRHVFHASCIDTWLESHVTCPVCRANLADPTVITAGQYLLDDLAEEQLGDPVEIVVEMFRPELDPDPDPGPELEITPVPIYPDNVIKEIDFAKQHRRAASLVSFQKTRISTGAFGSFIRTLSVSGHNRALLDPGEGSGKKIQMPRDDVAGRSGSTCSEKERSYEHSVTFTGFVLRGDVAEDDWLPEIFQISGAVQQS